jgi:hypothetical protein
MRCGHVIAIGAVPTLDFFGGGTIRGNLKCAGGRNVIAG